MQAQQQAMALMQIPGRATLQVPTPANHIAQTFARCRVTARCRNNHRAQQQSVGGAPLADVSDNNLNRKKAEFSLRDEADDFSETFFLLNFSVSF
jgi:hypothetical protein